MNHNAVDALLADIAETSYAETRRLRRAGHEFAGVMTALNLCGIVAYPDGPEHSPYGFDYMGSAEVTPRELVGRMVGAVGLKTFESLRRALSAADEVFRCLTPRDRLEAMCGARRRWVWEDRCDDG